MADLRLNLGSGSQPLHDYLNIDLHKEADIQHDLTTPLPFSAGEVDKIYTCHVVEHFTRKEWEFVRRDWARVLKPGGELEIYCPDILKLAQHLVEEGGPAIRIEQVYGQQAHPGEFHKNGFTEESLAASFPGFTHKVQKAGSDYELHMVLTKNVA